MTAPVGLGLARVTVAAPKRRIDVALPDSALVAELLPHLLRHAGEELADEGEEHGGWTLRRATGGELEPTRSLAVQGVRDGEVLHLAPRRLDWPELAYDDVVEVIASSARRVGRSWGNAATRRCALAVTSALFGLGVVNLLLSGPPWLAPGAAALGFAAVLGSLGAPHLLVGSAALVVFGVAGSVGVAAAQRVFIAGAGTGIAGGLAALLCLFGMGPAGAAAVVVTLAISLLPGYPLAASWLGKLPVPPLPERPEEIMEDRPAPRRSVVFAAVARSHELLSGMLLATAVVSAAGTVVLVLNRSGAGELLALSAALALLLRGRLFPTPVQRVPLLVSGLAGLALLTFGMILRGSPGPARLVPLVLVATAAALVLTAGLMASRRAPSPYVGRVADIVDVLAIMALIPLACAVAGVFHAVQGLFASVG
ncbi:MAG: type VII secretion integral membrane protein EccD [Actinobacteria bacterium 13_2_20CM_2_71_6]|nr:MAG: type VII secretion integral membrane protein EccD [Actinobacteria bacterium 13_2_20CM_2_71_6]